MGTPQNIGRYEILGELGQGAMGSVYRARDPAMDRVVALKTIISVVLAGQNGNEFRERFYREARAAGALAHPGIVPVFDVGEHEGMPFLVMEFVTGKTLADALKKGERLNLDRVCEIGQKIAEALGYAHQRGVVHRDIKPANILLTSREVYGIERPKITDFGVAKLAEGQTTMTGQMLGTPSYMPPEQFTGAPIDGRADIFSLGVVLYWMATGEQPFPGESMTAVSYKVVHTEPVPPRKLNPSLPVKLEAIILKCLAKSPSDRFQTGEDLARELGELRSGATAAPVQNTQSVSAGRDPNATIIDAPPMVAAAGPAASSPQPARAAMPATVAPKNKRDARLVPAVVIAGVIVVAAAGGWYAFRSRPQSPPQQVAAQPIAAVPEAPAPAPMEAAAPKEVVAPAAAIPKAAPKSIPGGPSAGAGVPAKKPATNAAPAAAPEPFTPPKAAESPREPAALGFDPKTLDPRQNAALKIDAEQMPPGLDFSVEMNGKLYFRKTGAASDIEEAKLFVPPGVQEFRVTARSGAVEKQSNTVSTEFKGKKRNTLKIELRTQGMAPGAGVPQGLYPDTQIVLTLK